MKLARDYAFLERLDDADRIKLEADTVEIQAQIDEITFKIALSTFSHPSASRM